MKKRLSISLDQKQIANLEKVTTNVLILGTHESKSLSQQLKKVDSSSKGILKKLVAREEIQGKIGQSLYIPSLDGVKAERVFIVGCGKKSSTLSKDEINKVLTKVVAAAISSDVKDASVNLPALKTEEGDEWILNQLSLIAENQSYTYDAKLNKKNKRVIKLKSLKVSIDSSINDTKLRKALKVGQAIGQGSNAAKELANLPGNVCTPSYIASASKTAAKNYDTLTCKVLGEKEMKRLGMDCLLSVGAGSAQESKLITLEYKGGKKDDQPHVLVGKGITFDTGGISLKPGGAMDEMKFDMCGAASVVGTLQVAAELKLPINVVGVIASAENMPGSKATKPGDVVRTMAGLTVEILNTDAEGRLVLADALTYAERFKPKSVVDIATLTGAVIMALGYSTSGLMSKDDSLANELLSAGDYTGDRAWRLPIWNVYQKDLDSNFADIANIGGRAGTITAACFLSRFTENYKWAHLDVAGTAQFKGAAKGGSGRPVPLLSQYLINKS
jgi:leucyl aminopeptidase